MASTMNDIHDHAACGDAKFLIPLEFSQEFGKSTNVKAPLLLCSADIFKQSIRSMTAALPEGKWQYAMKTNDLLGLIAITILEGHGLDCSSLGEILMVEQVAKALEKDVTDVMGRCSYGNPNKTTSDIKAAFDLGVRMFSVDSKEEIAKMSHVAKGARVYLRTHVDSTQETAISVFTNKFGAPIDTLPELAVFAKEQGLVPYGVGLSVGGGQTDPGAFEVGVEIASQANRLCRKAGVITMKGLTYCGGLPAQTAAGAPTFETIGRRIRAACEEHRIAPKDITFEPGRSLGTTCGIIRAKVITLKAPMQDGAPWTLVLNIGPFKGLFEMERTNLTYKMAAYFKPDDEVIPCRIVDDTCDSKGVCFKEQIVKMPKSLVEGSDVFFVNAGSYTTAYVMEKFNRTLPLIARCFPDPLADLELPAWLKGVPTPGEAAHGGVDFKALWTERGMLETDAERVTLSVDNAPGSGILGVGLLTANQVSAFRQINTAMLERSSNTPGDALRISFQPQQLFKDMHEGWIANSAILTLDLWNDLSNIRANAGAKVYLCFQNQYRSTVRRCTLMHATLVVVPDDKADGPVQFLEVNYNPYTIASLDATVVKSAFGDALCNERVYRDPQSDFEKLMVGDKLHPELANADLVWGGSLEERQPLADYWPEATATGGKKRPINLEGVLGFDFDQRELSVLLQHLAFIDFSYQAGYGVSNRAHIDNNSCLRTTIRALVVAKLGRDHHFGNDLPTDQVIEHLAKVAPRRWWTEEPGHSIRDLERFEKSSKSVGVEEFIGNIQSILCHTTMMNAFREENAYNTSYMVAPTVPHTDYFAQEYYRADAALSLGLLTQQAVSLGAAEGN